MKCQVSGCVGDAVLDFFSHRKQMYMYTVTFYSGETIRVCLRHAGDIAEAKFNGAKTVKFDEVIVSVRLVFA